MEKKKKQQQEQQKKSESASNFYSSQIDQMKLKAQHIRNDDYVIGVINLTKR